jgi:hypothetical protein
MNPFSHQRKGIGGWVVRTVLIEARQAGLPVSLSVLKNAHQETLSAVSQDCAFSSTLPNRFLLEDTP